MKMHKHFGLVLTACLVLSLLFTPAFLLPAQAANTVTVQGKVMSGTTGSLLLLDTPQGKMEIKIDNATDTTARSGNFRHRYRRQRRLSACN